MNYAQVSKMAQLHQPATDVRHPMYEMGDKLWGLTEAVGGDPVMKADGELSAKLDQLKRAEQAVRDHLNAHYLWD